MRKILAVAELDWRRLSLVLLSLALVSGLVPSLASGLGERVPLGSLLALNLVAVGVVCGGRLGADFSEGRSSFFFARPVTIPAFLLGRVTATAGLALASSLALLASYWLSSPEPFLPRLSLPNMIRALEFTTNGWAVALYFSLAVASRDRSPAGENRPRRMVESVLRIGLVMAAFIFTFGLFADLVVRAYLEAFGVVRAFLQSWLLAMLAASGLAIAAGRTERMRIARTQSLVMFLFLLLAVASVGAAWTYTLRPDAQAIRSVHYAVPSPDGRLAFVRAAVDRGDRTTFVPVFTLDPKDGTARLLTADPGQGPWLSSDGGTMAWVEATPFFFRPLFWMFGGRAGFKVRTGAGVVEDIPMPVRIQTRLKSMDLITRLGWFREILPSNGGGMFAVRWGRSLTFVSRTGVELSEFNLGAAGREVTDMSFLSSGHLRVALAQRLEGRASVEFLDLDPATGLPTHLASAEADLARFDSGASRALVMSWLGAGQGSVALIDLRTSGAPVPVTLVKSGTLPTGLFLADGRIATSGVGREGGLNIFSAAGERILDVPAEKGTSLRAHTEIFPGLLAVRATHALGADELTLVDSASGVTVRRLPRFSSLASGFIGSRTPPPPGSPAARLIQSDGKLYELPSPTGEPRPLLPLPVR